MTFFLETLMQLKVTTVEFLEIRLHVTSRIRDIIHPKAAMGKNCNRFTSADPRVEDRARPLTQDISTSKSLALNDGLNSD